MMIIVSILWWFKTGLTSLNIISTHLGTKAGAARLLGRSMVDSEAADLVIFVVVVVVDIGIRRSNVWTCEAGQSCCCCCSAVSIIIVLINLCICHGLNGGGSKRLVLIWCLPQMVQMVQIATKVLVLLK